MKIPRFAWVCLGVVAACGVLAMAGSILPRSERLAKSGSPEGADWKLAPGSPLPGAHRGDEMGGRSVLERRQAAEVASEAVAHGLAGLGAGEGPVHVLHDYRSTGRPATGRPTGRRPRDERQLQR